MIFGMLIDVAPFAEESLLGFLHRLASANGLNASTLIDEFTYGGDDSICELAMIAKKHWSWPLIAAELITPSTQPMPVWNLRRRRYCAHCLSEGNYWRAAWDLSLVTTCNRHQVELIDSCPICGQDLFWHRQSAYCCPHCGHELASVLTNAAPASFGELWLSSEFIQRLSQRTMSRNHLSHLDLCALHQLAFRLGSRAAYPEASKPMKVTDARTLAVAREIAKSAAQCLNDWPRGLFSTLNQIRQVRKAHSGWKVRTALGPIFRELMALRADADYGFLRDAFQEYLHAHWPGPLSFRQRRLCADTVTTHKWVPIRKTAEKYYITRSLIERLADFGQISSQSQDYASGRKGRVVNSEEVRALSERLRMATTVEDASLLLGLSKVRIKQLLRAEILTSWGGPPKPGARWCISRDSIDKLGACGHDAPDQVHLHRGEQSLGHLLRYCVNDEESFLRLISAILRHDINVVGKMSGQRGLGGWVVDHGKVDEVLKGNRIQTATDLTLVEASIRLGVKQEVAYALVRGGLLQSHQLKIGRRVVLLTSTQALETFSQNYAFGTELAAMLHTTPKMLVSQLERKGIRPAAGPTVAESLCRQYCWHRTATLQSLIAEGNDS